MKKNHFIIAGTAANMLDVWLPVVNRLKESSEASFTIFYSYNFILTLSAIDDINFKIAENFGCNHLINFGKFSCKFKKIKNARIAIKIFEKFRLFFRIVESFNILKILSKLTKNKILIDVCNRDWQSAHILLFDSSHYPAPGVYGQWMINNNFIKCFSMVHMPLMANAPFNLNLLGIAEEFQNFDIPIAGKTHFFVSSFRKDYRDKNIHAVGIARHSSYWVNKIINNYNSYSKNNKKIIVVFSRGADNHLLPMDRKMAAIKSILDFSRKNNYFLIVKKHPTEKYSEIEDIIGKHYFNVHWTFSNEHPLYLGSIADVAVVFHSSVVSDLLRIGMIAIEYLDLRGLSSFDNSQAEKDHDGKIIWSSYRKNKCVIPAEDYDDFNSAVSWLFLNKDKIKNLSKKKYHQLVSTYEDQDKTIARIILSRV